jgi:hypothetical protein
MSPCFRGFLRYGPTHELRRGVARGSLRFATRYSLGPFPPVGGTDPAFAYGFGGRLRIASPVGTVVFHSLASRMQPKRNK